MMDLLFKVSRNCGELLKRSFQIFHNLGGDDVGVGRSPRRALRWEAPNL
jgi:hypothetical protein